MLELLTGLGAPTPQHERKSDLIAVISGSSVGMNCYLGGRGARFNLKHSWISCSIYELMFNKNCTGGKDRPSHCWSGDGAHHKPVIKSLSRHWEEAIIGEGQAHGFRAC